MKKFFKKFNDLQFTIFLEGIIGVLVIGLSCIGLVFNQTGWLIGAATGTVVAILSTLLVFKGSDGAMRETKMGLYFLFYFVRMLLFIGIMILFAVLQYKLKVSAFDYSIFGALIGYTPMFIILIVGQVKGNRDLDKKVAEKNKEE